MQLLNTEVEDAFKALQKQYDHLLEVKDQQIAETLEFKDKQIKDRERTIQHQDEVIAQYRRQIDELQEVLKPIYCQGESTGMTKQLLTWLEGVEQLKKNP